MTNDGAVEESRPRRARPPAPGSTAAWRGRPQYSIINIINYNTIILYNNTNNNNAKGAGGSPPLPGADGFRSLWTPRGGIRQGKLLTRMELPCSVSWQR